MPLQSEVTRRRVPASATMPEFWRLEYRGVSIWERMHPPTESDVRDALQQHAARQQAAT